MMRLYFVRHGESETSPLHVISNRGRPQGLTELGRQQAAALQQALELEPIGRIYTSPLLPAVQTAEVLARAWGVPTIETEALREYDTGRLDGLSDEAILTAHQQVLDDWLVRGDYDSRPPEGESFRDIQARFVPFVQGLLRPFDGAAEPDPGDQVLVGHGGLFALMLPLVLDNVGHAFAQAHPIGNTSVVVAEHRKERLACLSWCGVALPAK